MCNETPNHSSFTWLQIFLTVLIKGVFSREEALILQYRGRAEIFKARPWDLAEQFFLEATQLNLAMLRGKEGEDAMFGLLLFPLNPFPGGSFNPLREPRGLQAPAAALASPAALPAHFCPVLFPDFSLLAADTAALCTSEGKLECLQEALMLQDWLLTHIPADRHWKGSLAAHAGSLHCHHHIF